MFTIAQETDDPTTVIFSTYGKFLHGEGRQLLTISGRLLRLFRVNPYALIPPSADDLEWEQKTKLECVFSTKLLSRVQSMDTARLPQYPDVDSILLAFDDGKLSIVAVHQGSNQLITVSMHYYETETLRAGYTKNFDPPLVKADPSNRCAAMLVYGRHLAIVPFQEGREFVHTYVTPLISIDPRLENVVDMVFLDGYYEPTIMFLYEPLQTTAGRASIRNDTFCTMAVSVNVFDKQMAVVWQQSQLPLDCYRLVPVPRPMGGALLVGTNDVIYLNQASPAFGVSVNSCFDGGFTKFPLKDLKHLSIVLDAASCTYIGDGRFLICSKEGKMYSIILATDSSFACKMMEIKEIAECSIPNTLTMCAPGHVFLGSRLGDSQLLEYTVKEVVEDEITESEDTLKKEEVPMDEDDMELYGSGETTVKTKEKVVKDVVIEIRELDRLINYGPIRAMTAGSANKLSDVFDGRRMDPVFDIVTASGHAKDGSLCMLQRSLRPDVVTSSCIEGAQQLWAVGRCEDDSHRYLIVSRQRSTLVLELDEDMVELEDPLFISGEPTIAAGELADGALAVQVTSLCIALVADGQQLQLVEIDSNHPVVTASIVDPFVALLTQNGRLLIYQLEMSPAVHLKQLDLTSIFSPDDELNKVTAMCIYRDLSGLMLCSEGTDGAHTDASKRGHLSGGTGHGSGKEKDEPMEEDEDLYGQMDETDRLLYGESSTKAKAAKEAEAAQRKKRRHGEVQSAKGGEESDAVDPNTVEMSYWLLLARENGRLVIHSLPDMNTVFQTVKFGAQLPLLSDADATDEEREKKEKAAAVAARDAAVEREGIMEAGPVIAQRTEERVVEIHLTGMGFNQGRPILFVLVDDCVVMYELFKYQNPVAGHLSIRLRRLNLTLCARSSPFMGTDGRRGELQCGGEGRHRPLFSPFERIGGVMHGVFVCGSSPGMVLMSSAGGLIHHPITIDGAIRSFTSFNNRNIHNGFLYLTELNQSMRIAKLVPEINYDMSIPCRKVPLGKTPHFVRYLLPSQVYVVVSSTSARSDRLCVVVNEEKTIETHDKPASFVCPEAEEYTLSLFSPEDWCAVPNSDIKLQEMEVVTCCEEVLLKSESTMSGFQNYIAIGTICNYGEEVLIRGRVILCEVIEVVPEPGMPTSNRKLKVVYEKEQKGPLTSLCSSGGYLVTGMGQKVFVWAFKDNQLQGVAFLDLQYYIHHVVSVRNLILACDLYASIGLLRYQEKFKALSLASHDNRQLAPPPMASQFLIDNKYTGIIMSDEACNIYVFAYRPDEDTNWGEQLAMRAHLNVGTVVNCWIRIKAHTSQMGLPTQELRMLQAQQTCLYASLDGSFGFVRPLREKTYRRLHFLSQIMLEEIPQVAGLHPVSARLARPQPVGQPGSSRSIVDGDFVSQYMQLSTPEKKDLARKLGTNRYQIMDDILNIRKLVTFY